MPWPAGLLLLRAPAALPLPLSGISPGEVFHFRRTEWHWPAARVVKSWKGDSQATAPIGRKASTNVTPVLESIQTVSQDSTVVRSRL